MLSWDILIFFIVSGATVLFGASFFRKNTSTSAYTSGEKKIPAWVAGLSIFATYVSSISFLALPGKTYQSNWNAFVFSLSIPLAAWIAVRFFIPLYRMVGSVSAYQYLESRFGLWARVYAASCYLLTQWMRTGAILLLLAIPLQTAFGWNQSWIILVTGLTVTAYAMMGGIRAVIWTDALQALILITGAVVVTFLLVFRIPGGIMEVFRIGTQGEKFDPGSFGASLSESTFWVVLVYGLFINLQNFGIDQNYIQRYMVTGTESGAKKSAWMGSMLYIPVSLLFCFIGTALYAYYNAYPDLLPPELKGPGAADQVFPYFIVHDLPAGFTGLLVAALFAAGMSTISTSINSSATILLTDFYKKFILAEPGNKKEMRVLYLSSLWVGLAGICIALSLQGVKSILDAWWALASVFSGGMLGLFLLGYLSDRTSSRHALVGVIAGVISIVWLSLSPLLLKGGPWSAFANPFHPNLTIVFGTSVIFLTGFLLSYLAANRKK